MATNREAGSNGHERQEAEALARIERVYPAALMHEVGGQAGREAGARGATPPRPHPRLPRSRLGQPTW